MAQDLRAEFDRPSAKVGRPRTPANIERMIVRVFKQTTWGTTRIAGAIASLYSRTIDPRTVAAILRRHDIDPVRHQAVRPRWKPLIDEYGNALAATDFFTAKVWTMRGLKTAYVMFVMHLGSRAVTIAGVSYDKPDTKWAADRARELKDPETGFFTKHGIKGLIHDGEGCLISDDFKRAMLDEGKPVEPMRIPPNSPNLNAFAERWVQTVKPECLNRVEMIDIGGLKHVLNEFLAHYHRERHHQGIGNEIIDPEKVVTDPDAPIEHFSRLGGTLHYYKRSG